MQMRKVYHGASQCSTEPHMLAWLLRMPWIHIRNHDDHMLMLESADLSGDFFWSANFFARATEISVGVCVLFAHGQQWHFSFH